MLRAALPILLALAALGAVAPATLAQAPVLFPATLEIADAWIGEAEPGRVAEGTVAFNLYVDAPVQQGEVVVTSSVVSAPAGWEVALDPPELRFTLQSPSTPGTRAWYAGHFTVRATPNASLSADTTWTAEVALEATATHTTGPASATSALALTIAPHRSLVVVEAPETLRFQMGERVPFDVVYRNAGNVALRAERSSFMGDFFEDCALELPGSFEVPFGATHTATFHVSCPQAPTFEAPRIEIAWDLRTRDRPEDRGIPVRSELVSIQLLVVDEDGDLVERGDSLFDTPVPWWTAILATGALATLLRRSPRRPS